MTQGMSWNVFTDLPDKHEDGAGCSGGSEEAGVDGAGTFEGARRPPAKVNTARVFPSQI